MAQLAPLIISAATTAATQELLGKRAEKARRQESLNQTEALNTNQKINDRVRRQRYTSLLASERARLGAAGVGAKSSVADAILSGLTRRMADEQTEASNLYALDADTLRQREKRNRRRNLLESTLDKL